MPFCQQFAKHFIKQPMLLSSAPDTIAIRSKVSKVTKFVKVDQGWEMIKQMCYN